MIGARKHVCYCSLLGTYAADSRHNAVMYIRKATRAMPPTHVTWGRETNA